MAISEIIFDENDGPLLKVRSLDGTKTKQFTVNNNGKIETDGIPIFTVVGETFASTNARFFGELGLPKTQSWTDTETGSATIDLVDDNVFGTIKQVVKHNDDVTNGSTTSQFSLSAQNWSDINTFGDASFSGITRLDTTNGDNGFFSGLQADAVENPLATGNRRYGILFDNNGGNLRVTESDTGGTTVTFDGTGGNPLVTFDEWVSWECVVPSGLGAAQFYVNGTLTTFAPTFLVNGGGLGTKSIISSGSTAGVNRVSYHDNFGVTIHEESETKTLAAATMAADVAQVFIPEGRRDYSIILPDGNSRPIGAQVEIVANNVFGTVKLTNQDTNVPEILYNGLRTLIFTVTVKDIFTGINTVNNGNVYLGFGGENAKNSENAIKGQFSHSVSQKPSVTTPVSLLFNTNDIALEGISHSTTVKNEEFTATIQKSFTFMLAPQWERVSGSASVTIDFFVQKSTDGGTTFVDIPNSNIKLRLIPDFSNLTNVIPLMVIVAMNKDDIVRFQMRVSTMANGLGTVFTAAETGPPTIPATPAQILTIFSGD